MYHSHKKPSEELRKERSHVQTAGPREDHHLGTTQKPSMQDWPLPRMSFLLEEPSSFLISSQNSEYYLVAFPKLQILTSLTKTLSFNSSKASWFI